MADTQYQKELLESWEEIFKKGQLTLWVLLALKSGPKYMAEISEFISSSTNGSLTIEDQSLYRALRRYNDAEMVAYKDVPGEKGPTRKEYVLTALGRTLLQQFLERNIIQVYFSKQIQKLILDR